MRASMYSRMATKSGNERASVLRGIMQRVPTRSGLGRPRQDEMGRQQFNRWLSVESSGNGPRYRKKYAAFLEPHVDDRLTTDTLFSAYRETVTKQLAA